MQPYILAGRIVLFRLLRLLITVTVESPIYRKDFRISPRQAVEYALVVDMLAEICGTIVFVFLQSILPLNLTQHLIIYLILDDFQALSPEIFVLNLLYFLLFLFAKWIGVLLLDMFVFPAPGSGGQSGLETAQIETVNQWGSQFKTVAKAHTISYAVTLLFAFFKIRIFNF